MVNRHGAATDLDAIFASLAHPIRRTILEQLSDPPSYSAVRALLRVLEEKGHLRHEEDGPRYVFLPTVPRERARQSALRQVLHTFFDGSTEEAVAALLDLPSTRLSDAELERLSKLIADARKEGR